MKSATNNKIGEVENMKKKIGSSPKQVLD